MRKFTRIKNLVRLSHFFFGWNWYFHNKTCGDKGGKTLQDTFKILALWRPQIFCSESFAHFSLHPQSYVCIKNKYKKIHSTFDKLLLYPQTKGVKRKYPTFISH